MFPLPFDRIILQVKYAFKHNVPFLASGGGHGYSTSFGALQNGLKIDLGLFNGVTIDTDQGTMTIGGSTKFSQVVGPLFKAGKEIRKDSPHSVSLPSSLTPFEQKLAPALAWEWWALPLEVVLVDTKAFTVSSLML